MDFTRRLSFIVFILCLLISLKNHEDVPTVKEDSSSPMADFSPSDAIFVATGWKLLEAGSRGRLRYDYYNESCPFAEQIIRSEVRDLYRLRPHVAPALLRLAFHDCFIEGCDASVLLDPADGMESEKDSSPNESLKGFDLIDTIKLAVEETCPGVVSCADIIVLSARESVVLAGGPFYPLFTGRKDSTSSHPEEAAFELPTPHDDLSRMIELFASKGFDEREIVSLLGAHSTGTIHCRFFANRLLNFDGSEGPDPSIDAEFLDFLRSKCNISLPSSAEDDNFLTTLFNDQGINMDAERSGTGFGTLYYFSLLQGKGLLFVDQQLTAGEEAITWVRAYASDALLFRRDFGLTMMKLSNHQVLTEPLGEVRLNCRTVN